MPSFTTIFLCARAPWPALMMASIALGACSKPEPPTVTPRSVRVASLTPAAVGLAVDLDVHNKNSFPLLVHRVDGTLELGDGVEFGRGQASPNASIAAKSSTPVSSQLSVGWTNLAALAPFALSGQPVIYTFRGVAALGGEKLNVTVPFVLDGQLTREQLLAAGLAGLGAPSAPP